MLEGWFPNESQVGLSVVIASNSGKLVKANFGSVTLLLTELSQQKLTQLNISNELADINVIDKY